MAKGDSAEQEWLVHLLAKGVRVDATDSQASAWALPCRHVSGALLSDLGTVADLALANDRGEEGQVCWAQGQVFSGLRWSAQSTWGGASDIGAMQGVGHCQGQGSKAGGRGKKHRPLPPTLRLAKSKEKPWGRAWAMPSSRHRPEGAQGACAGECQAQLHLDSIPDFSILY